MEEDLRSVLWASKTYEVHPKRLAKLLAMRGFMRSGPGEVARFAFTVEAAAYLQDLSTAMSLNQAAIYINAPRPHDRLLVEAGHLAPFIVGGVGGIKDHAFARRDLDGFLERLLAPARGRALAALIPIQGAMKRASCSAMEIVGLVLSGRLERLAVDPAERGYLSLLVDPEEIKLLVQLGSHGGLSLREVEKRLGTTTAVVSALIAGGHLPSQQGINPVKRQPQTVVTEEALQRFSELYVSLHELARIRQSNPGNLKRELAGRGVEPALGNVPASFYTRSSLAEISASALPDPSD